MIYEPPPDALDRAREFLSARVPGYLDTVRGAAARLGSRAVTPRNAEEAIAAVEALAEIDVDPPTLGQRRAAVAAKKAVKPLVAWYFRYVGQQLTALGEAVALLGRMLNERVDALDERNARLVEDLSALTERVQQIEQGRTTGEPRP